MVQKRETKSEERDRLYTRTDALQDEHDAMKSPPRSAAEKLEHVEHRKSLRKHKADLRANTARAPDK
jgi:hypothetical protein